VLTVADLEVNVLEFRHRSFQFERLVERADGPCAVFSRTETESERQLRPRLIHLALAVPQGWIVLDPESDLLRVGRDGRPPKVADATAEEIASEPSEFDEQGVRWRRAPVGPTSYVYAPVELAPSWLAPSGLAELGFRPGPDDRA